MKNRWVIACGLVWVSILSACTPAPVVDVVAKSDVGPADSMRSMSPEVPEALRWEGGFFEIAVEETAGQDYDALIRFASPKPSGDAAIDTVVLRWYRPVLAEPEPEPILGVADQPLQSMIPETPAVLLVHTLHPDLPVATLLARGLRQRGVHALVIELPGYASRVGSEPRMTGVTTLIHAAQAVADCRRSYDVIRYLNDQGLANIDENRIAIQGTSLGSFIATSAAALDGCFDQTFLFLSGGDGVDILETGQKDAFHVRGALKHYGYTGDKLRALLDPVEPLRIAHRLDPETTWMFNARSDLVVPAKNANLLAEAIGLDESQHVWMPGNHYTAFLLLPGVLDRIKRELGVEATP